MGKFVYKERSAKSIRDREQSGSGFDRFTNNKYPNYRPGDGSNTIRILPPGWLGDKKMVAKWGDLWGIEVWLHRNIGPDNATYPCLDKMKGKPCPICEARIELLAEEGDSGKYDKKGKDGKRVERPSDKLKPKLSILALLIDRDDSKTGPQLWVMPKAQVEREIQTRSRHKKTGAAILVDSPEDGFDISFEKTGSGLLTKYLGVDIAREPTPISKNPQRQEKWLDYITENPLPSTLKYYDYDYMEKIYMGKKVKERDDDIEDDDDEDEDEEEVKSKKKKSKSDDDDDDDDDEPKKKAKKKSKSDDDDDDDDSDDDDDDDEDEKPKKKAKKKSKSDDAEDDEDEESDDDDDDEDEKPKKKAKKKSKSDDDDDDDDEDDDDDKKDDDDDDDDKEDDDDDDDDDKPKKGSKAAKKAVEKLKKKKSKK